MRTADDLYQNRINVRLVMMQSEIFGKMRVVGPQRTRRFWNKRCGVGILWALWEFRGFTTRET